MILAAVFLASVWMCGCGGGDSGVQPLGEAARPRPRRRAISTTAAQNGAVIVSLPIRPQAQLSTTPSMGARPLQLRQQYQAPFLVASNLTVKAIAVGGAPVLMSSTVTSQTFSPNIPSGTLVWSDEFTNTSGAPAQPDPTVWTYDTGNSGFGNSELENYCAWGSSTSPCSTASPSEYVGDRMAICISWHSSRRLGVHLGAVEDARSVQLSVWPVGSCGPWCRRRRDFWPAAWLLGNNINNVNWPACGEQDVLERVNAAGSPDWNEGSVHGTGFTADDGTGHTVSTFRAGRRRRSGIPTA